MLRKFFRPGKAASNDIAYDLGAVQESAQQGRRLAIYDRATGLYAYWYLQLRGEEEISRAKRSRKPLACLSLWAADRLLSERLGQSLRDGLRDHDLAGYLNNGHFVVLLPETGEDGVDVIVRRIRDQTGAGVVAGVAIYPADGETFDDLLGVAKSRGGHDQTQVA